MVKEIPCGQVVEEPDTRILRYYMRNQVKKKL